MVDFQDLDLVLALATPEETPGPEVKARLLARVEALSGLSGGESSGFSFRLASEDDWVSHPVPGIRMKLLAFNRKRRYVTVLLEAKPGARLPPHHHSGAEETYVISGTLVACGRTIGPGDFHHAEGDTEHGELYTETGCRVLLVVPPEDYLPGFVDESNRPAPSAAP